MKRIATWAPAAMGLALVLSAYPCNASSASEPAQSPCASPKVNKNDGKFTGQITSGPNGSVFEVTSGGDTLLVRYSSAVPVCVDGQAASAGALSTGATVAVYGPTKRKGKVTEMDAINIVIGATSPAGMRAQDMAGTNYAAGRIGDTAGAGNAGSGGSMASGQIGAKDNWNAGASKTGSAGEKSGGVSCNALLFSVNSSADIGAGHASGRRPPTAITCKRAVDPLALQLIQDAAAGRRFSSVTLNWQGQLEATLSDVEITSVQFLSDNGNEVVQITYTSQKAELVYLPSGNRVTF